jgi:hypothetical protein
MSVYNYLQHIIDDEWLIVDVRIDQFDIVVYHISPSENKIHQSIATSYREATIYDDQWTYTKMAFGQHFYANRLYVTMEADSNAHHMVLIYNINFE